MVTFASQLLETYGDAGECLPTLQSEVNETSERGRPAVRANSERSESKALRHVATLTAMHTAPQSRRVRRSSLPARFSLDTPREEEHLLATTDDMSVHHAREKALGFSEAKKKRRNSTSAVYLLNAMAQYIEEKAERSVFPEQSLPHMTPRLDVRQSQRVYTLAESRAESERASELAGKPASLVGAGHKLPLKSGVLPSNALRNHAASTMQDANKLKMQKLEKDQVECETKRAAFREELNKRKRYGMKQRRYHSLEQILRRMRFQPKENKFGKLVDFDAYAHTSTPWTAVLYIIMLVAVYLLEGNVPDARTWLEEHWRFALVKIDANVCLRDVRGEVWRYLTYQFLHGGKQHLTGNCVTGLALGAAFEWTHGHTNFIVVLQAGVIAGCMASAIFKPLTIIIGASGGVYALGGAHLANLLINWNTMRRFGFYVRAISIASWCTWEVLQQLGVGLEKLNISHESHFGGFFFGVLVGVWFSDNLVLSQYDKYVKLGCLAIAFVVTVTSIVYLAINDVSTC